MTFDWFKYCSNKYPDYMTLDQLKVYVVKTKITEAEYKTISGLEYVA